jgi:ketosteroid isomerase-like protein
MSEENVEIVRQAWEAWVRKDNETALALYDPEVQIDLTAVPHIGRSEVYFGREGLQEWLRDMLASFGVVNTEVEEWIDAGERVIAMVHSYRRGKRSASRSTAFRLIFGPCATGCCCVFRSSRAEPRPSKPPGCGSRPKGLRGRIS